MKTVAYLRISTGSQDLANQKMAVLDYARQQRFSIDRFVEAQVSSRKTPAQRGIEDLLGDAGRGDRLVVSELSRLGRSLGQVIRERLVKDIRPAERSTAPTPPHLLGHGNAVGVQFVCPSRQSRCDTVVSKSMRFFSGLPRWAGESRMGPET